MLSGNHSTATRLGALLLLASSTRAALLTNLTALNGATYDYIVVGGWCWRYISSRVHIDPPLSSI